MQSRITSPFSTDLGYRLLPDSLFVSRKKILTPHLSSSSLPHENVRHLASRGFFPPEENILPSRGKCSSLPRGMVFPCEASFLAQKRNFPPSVNIPYTPRPARNHDRQVTLLGMPRAIRQQGLGLSTHPSHPLTIPLASCSFARRNQQGGKGEMRHNANFVVKMLCRTK